MRITKPVGVVMTSLVPVAVVIGCLLMASMPALSQAPTSPAPGFTFALIGDLGYFPREEPWVENVLADLNRNTSLAFVVHVGDLSSPRYSCTDEFLARRLAQFRASIHPVIYTPGDNEWTDCHKPKEGGLDPLANLAYVRDHCCPR